MANPFDQFDQVGGATTAANPFNQFDPVPKDGAPTRGQAAWGGVSHGVLPFVADRLQAATAATKESLSPGGLSFGNAYDQALSHYQNKYEQQQQAYPVTTGLTEAAGSVVPLMLGNGAINAGLRELGPVGKFFAGEPQMATVARGAGGQFRALNVGEQAWNFAKETLATPLKLIREGGQAGAFGAATHGNDIGEGAGLGSLMGVAGALATPIMHGMSRTVEALNDLPSWAKLGGLAGLTQIPHDVTTLASGAGAAGLAAMSRMLEQNPGLRDMLLRLGVAGAGSFAGAKSSPQDMHNTAPSQ